ncbi:MAG: hypothetical protein AUJ32_02490 [Parcubacteria group bacterium CG1_02_40_82]|uniref:Uncharacterized protein n=2 Tax=Candidatus Portnoyibacteriota TaxID=1817913 RepID=A0A2H0KSI5_9BACT|nr:MAG: hypothetical protein AUJ32_02490 [Parcubacteria group bacterium CG1_02_40_82]PIQ75096.1 MAG: hypothetical protein COV84_03330 [Candidatus Portnoybacteria bacterium CG11_big_fil_rev_8_21_14_0_20_40_15]PIS31308.1 MAG: hypothetical protein COT41_02145 [Candidatus Portnoybacteria bacterium CG08_land_8_20_14_0_20_40_83]PJA64595.1 MAG: hypothetical protein CO159_02195 [Candidatus Portnoybacteria bacterium CG_4_9_14_3_um_filter_40_10]
MPGSENQVVKIRLVPKAQKKNESNFYYLKNSTAAWPRSEISIPYGIKSFAPVEILLRGWQRIN